MIRIVQGNLLEASEDIIGHQVNCMGKYKSGIAGQIRDKYPRAYEMYMNVWNNYSDKRELLGIRQIVTCDNGRDSYGERMEKKITNLFGQYDYGRNKNKVYTDYEKLTKALVSLEQFSRLFGFSVALPLNLGCGSANGDWGIVYRIIDKAFIDHEVTLYEFK